MHGRSVPPLERMTIRLYCTYYRIAKRRYYRERGASGRVYEDLQDELNAEISRYVSLFTAGAYDSVRLDEQGQLQILTEGREVRPELLSCGTLEQIYLALRLAVGKVVTKEETLPILLDEAFAMYDDDRLAQTLQTLSTLQNQIFLFTCQKREVEMLKKMKLDYNLIEMEAYH